MSFFTSIDQEGHDEEPVLQAKNKIDGKGKMSDAQMVRLDKDVKSGNVHVYLFLYWRDCGHCKSSYGDWEKFESVIGKNKSVDKLAVYAIEQDAISGMSSDLLDSIGGSPDGFPTIRHVFNKAAHEYSGQRNIKAFTEWMHKTSGKSQSGGCSCGMTGGGNKGKKSVFGGCAQCGLYKGGRRRKKTRKGRAKKSRGAKKVRARNTRKKTRRAVV